MNKLQSLLVGKKTHLCALGLLLAGVLHSLGYLTDPNYQLLLAVLGAGGLSALRAAVSRLGPQE